MSEQEEEKVGYRKPPAKTRFKPGQSGNPSGRPKIIGPFREACQKFITEEGGFDRLKEFAMQQEEPRIALEAMKVMNEIKAEARGTIARILVDDSKPVQYGQPLFELK